MSAGEAEPADLSSGVNDRRAAPTVLERILASTREEVRRRKRELPVDRLGGGGGNLNSGGDGRLNSGGGVEQDNGGGGALKARRSLQAALAGPGISVIAEFKRRSPSAGVLRERPEVREIVGAYARGGAAALSILTEGPNFDGSLADLREARAACELPILRKDFILDPYQLHEARAAGADAVLLIVAALEQPALRPLHESARELGLDVLVEVHDRAELKRAIAVGATLIGINNRDLRDFTVDVARTFALLEELPDGVCVVSESGIATAGQLRELEAAGVRAVLVGERLMRAPDPEAAVRELLSGAVAGAPEEEPGKAAGKF